MSISQVEAAATKWSRPGGRQCNRTALPKARTRFVNHATRWLRFLGWLDEPEVARHPHSAEVAAYEAWMRSERGLSEATIQDCCVAAYQLFDWLAASDVPLASVKMTDIDGAIAAKNAQGTCSRRTIHDYAQRLRTFLRFAEDRRWCMPGMATAIMPPRFYRDETVPAGRTREDVVRLLATTEGDRPADKRDRAILMLLIAYVPPGFPAKGGMKVYWGREAPSRERTSSRRTRGKKRESNWTGPKIIDTDSIFISITYTGTIGDI